MLAINGYLKKAKIINIDDYMFYMCILDILFLPYIRPLSASISMIMLPIWYLFSLNQLKVSNSFVFFYFSLIFICLSVGLSAINTPQYLQSNIISLVILIYGFLYYFFFDYYFKRSSVSLGKPLLVYVTFAAFLAIVYYVNPASYFNLRSIWTMSGKVIELRDSLMIHRFTGTLSDPNNAATVFVGLSAYLIFSDMLKPNQIVFVLVATTVIVFATMSCTGIVLLGCVMLIFTLWLVCKFSIHRIKISSVLIFLVLIATALILYKPLVNNLNNNVLQLALKRFSINSIAYRTKIWVDMIVQENPIYSIAYGHGGKIVLNGRLYRPHNGHLHLIYNYGFIPYIVFMYIIFRYKKCVGFRQHIFLLPFFVGFTMNVGIIEPRFLNILVLLVSYSNNPLGPYREL